MAEFCLKDETAAAFALRLAGTGARLGVNGAPDATHPLAVAGAVFVKSGPLLGDDKCVGAAASPTSGSISVPGNGTATVTTNNGQEVIPIQDELLGALVGVDALNANDFGLRNGDATAKTVDYSYW